MEVNGHNFLDKVLKIVKEESGPDKPLIDFKHPKELEELLSLEVSSGVDDPELEHCIRQVLHYSVKTNRTSFRNQLYGGTDQYGLAGAWIAEAFNTSQYTYEVAPAFTLIEQEIIRHMLELFCIPDGDGIFSPGGSVSIMYGLVAARFHSFPEVKSKGMKALPELVVLTSEDGHYSVRKAAHWLGLGTENVININTNDLGQMLPKELEEAIKLCKDNNKHPIMVNATAGTTVLGAIDDLEAVADLCEKYKIWLHIDACWGGSLILSHKHKSKLRGIHRADSISWNPHKMLGTPLQCSALLVKKRGLLHEANSAAAHYLFQQDKFYDVSYDTGDKSIQCGRKIDAFKLWVMWKARGDHGLGSLVDNAMSMAEFCRHTLAKRPGFRLVAPEMHCPNVCFWFLPEFMRGKKEDELWWETMHKITPKIKEALTLSSRLLIGYSPLRLHKNFFRMAFTCHPKIEQKDVLDMIVAIEDCGELITMDCV